MPRSRSLLNCITTQFRISIFSALIAFGLVTSVQAEIPALLKDALEASAQDDGLCWAYTETSTPSIVNSKGKPFMADQLKLERTKTRVDPSKTYTEQYAPLEIDGKAPSQKRIGECKKQGEDLAKATENQALEVIDATTADAPESPQIKDSAQTRRIDTTSSGMDLDHATAVADNSQSTTYQVPLNMPKKDGFDPKNFELLLRVNKEQRFIENMHFRLKKPVRLKLIVKIKTLEVDVEIARIQPNLPPVVVALKCTGDGSFFFKTVKGSLTNTYENYVRVKSFDKRFHVKAGPLQFLKF